MSGRLPFGLRHYWKGHFLKALDEPLIDGVVEAMAARPDGLSVILLEAIRGVARTEPPDGTAFAQRGATWNASALGDLGRPGRRRRAHRLGARDRRSDRGRLAGAAPATPTTPRSTRPNERVRLAFGTERFERLAPIKARYDPDNRFRFNLNIAPAPPRPARD